MASLTLSNVIKRYGHGPKANQVIHGVNAEIADGEFIVIVGPSGCGKSTLLRMIAGLEQISGGDLFIGDERMNDVDPSKRGIAMVFQNYALYPHMSVRQNLEYGLKNRGTPRDEIDRRVTEAAKILEITPFLERKPRQLSGGQRQRIGIARALAGEPSFIVCDEPVSALDVSIQAQILNLFMTLREDLKLTYLFISHDLKVVRAMAHEIMVMRRGRVVEQGPADDIFNDPKDPYTRALMAAAFEMKADDTGAVSV